MQDEGGAEPPKPGEPQCLLEGDDYEPSILGEEGHLEDNPCDGADQDLDQVQKMVEELAKPLKVRHVTLMEPVETRNVKHVLPAMDAIITRLGYMGIKVTRIHSDRAKELLSRQFRAWVAHRNVFQTFTAGDDPQSKGHCEAEVNQLKRRTRLLLHAASQDNTQWPASHEICY